MKINDNRMMMSDPKVTFTTRRIRIWNLIDFHVIENPLMILYQNTI